MIHTIQLLIKPQRHHRGKEILIQNGIRLGAHGAEMRDASVMVVQGGGLIDSQAVGEAISAGDL